MAHVVPVIIIIHADICSCINKLHEREIAASVFKTHDFHVIRKKIKIYIAVQKSVIVRAWHEHIYVIIPGDKTLMPDTSEHGSSAQSIVQVIFPADRIEFSEKSFFHLFDTVKVQANHPFPFKTPVSASDRVFLTFARFSRRALHIRAQPHKIIAKAPHLPVQVIIREKKPNRKMIACRSLRIIQHDLTVLSDE